MCVAFIFKMTKNSKSKKCSTENINDYQLDVKKINKFDKENFAVFCFEKSPYTCHIWLRGAWEDPRVIINLL